MRNLLAHWYARHWARRHGCKYAKVRGIEKGIVELPTGQRFSFTTSLAHNRPIFTGFRLLRNQLDYSLRAARLEARQ